ncbi:CarD family transcriptional regulator [Numidum massiliense]|uniref:CarD family transcriptional regulator n=1 Tax=Numidum massiliense TaxID=1522315 RepID=UPI001E4B7C58|nr:CarD family transcriptional regulator [Numidum massiliense]
MGDKVVYPMHGAGIIEAIEEKEILGEKKQYYVMHLPVGNIKALLPMSSVNSVGLRGVVDEQSANRVIEFLKGEDDLSVANWNHRFRINLDKMRSGDIYELADVVRSLMSRDHGKGLSTGERKMLDTAKRILISELVLAKDMEEEQMCSLVDDTVGQKNSE